MSNTTGGALAEPADIHTHIGSTRVPWSCNIQRDVTGGRVQLRERSFAFSTYLFSLSLSLSLSWSDLSLWALKLQITRKAAPSAHYGETTSTLINKLMNKAYLMVGCPTGYERWTKASDKWHFLSSRGPCVSVTCIMNNFSLAFYAVCQSVRFWIFNTPI